MANTVTEAGCSREEVATNLAKRPECKKPITDQETATSGDIHGNALRLIYTLIEEGILEVSEEQCDRFYELYHTSPLQQQHLADFKELLGQVKVVPGKSFRLIGDVFSDRGANDYLTLLTLQKLQQGGVNLEINYSNHDLDFILWMEGQKGELKEPHNHSIRDLIGLCGDRIIALDEVQQLYQEVITPSMRLFSAEVCDGDLILYSHAPIPWRVVAEAAEMAGIEPNFRTAEDAVKTIELINVWFQQELEARRLHQHMKYHPDLEMTVNRMGYQGADIPKGCPLEATAWTRKIDPKELVTGLPFKVHNVHGHTGPGGVAYKGRIPHDAGMTHSNTDTDFAKLPKNDAEKMGFKENIEEVPYVKFSSPVPMKPLNTAELREQLKVEQLIKAAFRGIDNYIAFRDPRVKERGGMKRSLAQRVSNRGYQDALAARARLTILADQPKEENLREILNLIKDTDRQGIYGRDKEKPLNDTSLRTFVINELAISCDIGGHSVKKKLGMVSERLEQEIAKLPKLPLHQAPTVRR